VESALAAAGAGADRIELCVALHEDGLTPPEVMLRAVKAAVPIPIFVLVRCRPGGFVFSAGEQRVMLVQIELMRRCGADGIVCGALTSSGGIDLEATRGMVAAAGGLPFTFHKAFDACADLERGMAELVGLGVDRVLTSGGGRRAEDSMPRLARLAELGGNVTRVLCGGGVRSANISELMKIPGVLEFHSAARTSVEEPVDASEVRALRDKVDMAPR
jgi:copper homeostasis protein